MNLYIPWYSFSVYFVRKEKNRVQGKEKLLEDFYKGKNLAFKVLLDFQESTLHEFVTMRSLHL